MYAIVDQGGNQHKVREGEIVRILATPMKSGQTFGFDRVLFYNSEAGDIRIGKPVLSDVAVVGTVKTPARGPKTVAIRYKRCKGVRTRHGHHETYQQVRIDRITAAELTEAPTQEATKE
jgi:large subunit ribosomal protein L21